MLIELRKAVNRNTQCHVVRIGSVQLGYSYSTVVSVTGFDQAGNRVYARRKNAWGPTTGRHIKELSAHAWPVIEDEAEFEALCDKLIQVTVVASIVEPIRRS